MCISPPFFLPASFLGPFLYSINKIVGYSICLLYICANKIVNYERETCC